MKINNSILISEENNPSLQFIIRSVISVCQPIAREQNSIIQEKVPGEINLLADKDLFFKIFSDMLVVTSRCSRNTCLKISAESFQDMLSIYVQDKNTFNSYALFSKQLYLEALSRLMEGHFGFSEANRKETGFIFSFPNRLTT